MKYIYSFLITFLLAFGAMAQENNELHILAWSEYIPEDIVKEFTKETGIKVVISSFDSNEAMFAKLKLLGEKNGYDIVMPSTYYVSKLKNSGLLQKVDKSKIPNIKNIDSQFLSSTHNPEADYSVPYLWGITGIAYNEKYIKDKIDSWNQLFDPKYQNKLLLVDDVRDIFDIALLSLGYQSNETNPEHIKQAYEKLKTLMPNVRVWNSDSPRVLFINEEIAIGTCWNGDAYMIAQENPNIKFAFPKEGPILWLDNFVILKSAKNPDSAHKFINFIHKPEVSKAIVEKIGHSTPNKEALKILDPKVRDSAVMYPPKKYVDKGVFQADIGEAASVYAKYWEMLRAAK